MAGRVLAHPAFAAYFPTWNLGQATSIPCNSSGVFWTGQETKPDDTMTVKQLLQDTRSLYRLLVLFQS
ncbi:hypothetical protein PIIN_10886 [Serendipita indica DSM 11827]|uniref:Uncharacterized protein n=1 Tax=Serendipita indica (strain DSM 11827) TaxID=1109443 RepID=G4U008_SERID|nr:hypothetical protein PIIN_10886 [Serendipita indica DSM 11827]